MKIGKMHFAIALITLIMVAGCATAPLQAGGNATSREAETTVTETTTSTTSTSEPPAPAAHATASYEITDETMAKLSAVFLPGKNMAISEGSRKMSFGDSYVFAVGIGNPNIPSEEFKLKAELQKTYDSNRNTILSDNSLANSWIAANNFQAKTLNRGESIIEPFIVEIKNLLDGSKPKPGVYEFELSVMTQGNFEDFREEYASKTVTIQVI